MSPPSPAGSGRGDAVAGRTGLTSSSGKGGLTAGGNALLTSFRVRQAPTKASAAVPSKQASQASNTSESSSEGSEAHAEQSRAVSQQSSIADLLSGENVFPLVSGVLAIKVVSAEPRETKSLLTDSFVFARLSVRDLTKLTENARLWGSKLVWCEMLFFPIPVIRNPRHPFNLFQIELMSIPHYAHLESALSDESGKYLLGSVPFHVHDLVKGSPSMGSFTLTKDHRPVGTITLEIYFTYGTFGYGYSPQLKDGEDPERKLEFAMLPRSIPAGKRDEWSQTQLVRSTPPSGRILTDEGQKEDFPLVHARMRRLRSMLSHYDAIDPRLRVEKLAFLHSQINRTSQKTTLSTPPMFAEPTATSSRYSSLFHNYMRLTVPDDGAL
jgi:hypothetical protein